MLVGSMKRFQKPRGGACSLRGVGAAWGVQLGKIGGAGADQGSAGEAWGVQIVAMGVQVLTWGSSMGGAVQA